jgi:hypothetical protein
MITSPVETAPAGTVTLIVAKLSVVLVATVGITELSIEMLPAATAGAGAIIAGARKLRQKAMVAIMLTSLLCFSNFFPP